MKIKILGKTPTTWFRKSNLKHFQAIQASNKCAAVMTLQENITISLKTMTKKILQYLLKQWQRKYYNIS